MLFLGSISFVYSQEVSCQEIYEYLVENYRVTESVTCYGSTMLVKADFYLISGTGFVVAYIKSNDYDIYGKPYLFCGVSREKWMNFKSEGMYNSWGKAFHKYIRDCTCNCY